MTLVTNISSYNIYQEKEVETWTFYVALFCWILVTICAVFIAFFIHLEWSGSLGPYRTLINRLAAWNNLVVSQSYWSCKQSADPPYFQAIIFILMCQYVEFVRILVGPLPFWICELSYASKLLCVNVFANITVSMTITKFIIIAIWKKVPVMDDSFLAFFIISWASFLGSLTSFAKIYAPGRFVFNEVKKRL